jgi:hypothetical protein
MAAEPNIYNFIKYGKQPERGLAGLAPGVLGYLAF